MMKGKKFALLGILCVATLLLTVGTTLARFRENVTDSLAFQSETPESLTLRSDSGWLTQGSVSALSFTLENTTQQLETGKIYLLASQGIQSGSNLQMILTCEENQYTAVAQAIKKGSALYQSFGAGWVYRFVDEQGQELLWPIQAQSERAYLLTVESENNGDYHSLLRLVATKSETP